ASIRSMPALGGPRWLQHGLEEEHHPALDLCDLRWALRAHRLAGFLDVDNHMPLAATHRPTSFEEKQLACAINMRERFSGLQTKRCCEESTEANCLACCEEHFASRGGKCVEVCSTMCAFGWDKGNRKVPQCPEKLGTLSCWVHCISALLHAHLCSQCACWARRATARFGPPWITCCTRCMMGLTLLGILWQCVVTMHGSQG
ncbi:unnamed protein product, partial [Effrenium voratum]